MSANFIVSEAVTEKTFIMQQSGRVLLMFHVS